MVFPKSKSFSSIWDNNKLCSTVYFGALGKAVEYDFNSIKWHRNVSSIQNCFNLPLNFNFKAILFFLCFLLSFAHGIFHRRTPFVQQSKLVVCTLYTYTRCWNFVDVWLFFRKIIVFSQFNVIHRVAQRHWLKHFFHALEFILLLLLFWI